MGTILAESSDAEAARLKEQLNRPNEAWAWWIALQTYHPRDCAGAAENAARLVERTFAATSQVDPGIEQQLYFRGRVFRGITEQNLDLSDEAAFQSAARSGAGGIQVFVTRCGD